MTDYSLEALGQVVKRLRRKQKLTQEELGKAAEYGTGAGVSISRLENGRLEPTDKFAGIARALGLSAEELRALAAGETAALQSASADGAPTHDDRIATIVRASKRRKGLDPALAAFNVARQDAETNFLMKLRDIAARVVDMPARDEADLRPVSEAPSNAAAAEASFQLQFTQYGVSKALAQPHGGGEATHPAFVEAVALGAAPLGATVPRLAGAASALNGLRAAMGVGRSARVLGSGAGVNLVAAVAAGAVVATILERQATAKKRRVQETAAKLEAAEAEIAANQPNVEALIDVIPRATEILGYIAVHASHALTRWGGQIGDERVLWKNLARTEQQTYDDFVAVAAAQLAVASIDFQELATSRGNDLEQVIALADQVLIQSQRAITSRV